MMLWLCSLVWLALLLSFVAVVANAAAIAQRTLRSLHQIPCDRCIYFSGCTHLQCAVNPLVAMTPVACECRHFQAAPTVVRSCNQPCDRCQQKG